MIIHRCAPAVLLAAALAAAGCTGMGLGQGTTQGTRFYVLNSLDPFAGEREAPPLKEDLAVAVAPVRIAAYLKRPHIVTSTEGNEVLLAEFARWAEPLEDAVSRVLAENLSILLGIHGVVVDTPRSLLKPRYTVMVRISRLDGSPGGEALLVARWGIAERETDEVLLTKRSVYRRPVKGAGYGDLAAAENGVLEDLCREIAEAIGDLPGAAP